MFASVLFGCATKWSLRAAEKYYSNAAFCEDRVDGPARRINHILAGDHFGSSDGGSQDI
jgi:hypothetical protein